MAIACFTMQLWYALRGAWLKLENGTVSAAVPSMAARWHAMCVTG
jgi:hypothetical protein